MRKKITIKISLGLLVLITLIVCGCSSAMTAPQAEGKTMAVKKEGVSLSSSGASGGAGVGMLVLWKVSDYKMGPNPVWGEKEARAMIFKPLDITETAITFDGKTCGNVTFKKETLKAKEGLAFAFHTTPQTLGIADEAVDVITSTCDLPGFDRYLHLKDGRVVIYLNGVFFYFKPKVNY